MRRATAVVDLASSRAGDQALGPGARRYLIQLVLAGEGGIDPSEAADILEFSAEGADLRLGTLITMIRRIAPLAPQPSEDPPGNPGPGGHEPLFFPLGHLLLEDTGMTPARRPSPPSDRAGSSDD